MRKWILLAFLIIFSITIFKEASASSAPLSVDQISGFACSSGITTCTSIAAFSPQNDNDLIVIFISDGAVGINVQSINDTFNLGFVQRGSVGLIEEWYAKDVGTPVHNEKFTVNLSSGPPVNWGVDEMSVSGTNLSNPFGPSVTNLIEAGPIIGCSGFPTITTSNVNAPEMIVAALAKNTSSIPGTDSGFAGPDGSPGLSSERQIPPFNPVTTLQLSFGQNTCSNSKWSIIIEAFCSATSCNGGGQSPNPSVIRSVAGPGGTPIPPQLADSNVLNFIGILAAIILLSAIPIKKREKKKNSFTG